MSVETLIYSEDFNYEDGLFPYPPPVAGWNFNGQPAYIRSRNLVGPPSTDSDIIQNAGISSLPAGAPWRVTWNMAMNAATPDNVSNGMEVHVGDNDSGSISSCALEWLYSPTNKLSAATISGTAHNGSAANVTAIYGITHAFEFSWDGTNLHLTMDGNALLTAVAQVAPTFTVAGIRIIFTTGTPEPTTFLPLAFTALRVYSTSSTILAIASLGDAAALVRFSTPTDVTVFDPLALGGSGDYGTGIVQIDAYTAYVPNDLQAWSIGSTWTINTSGGGVPWPGATPLTGSFKGFVPGIISVASLSKTSVTLQELITGTDSSFGPLTGTFQWSSDGVSYSNIGGATKTGLTPGSTYYFRASYTDGVNPVTYSPVLTVPLAGLVAGLAPAGKWLPWLNTI